LECLTSLADDLRDRALIGLMVYTFSRVGAAVSMKGSGANSQSRSGTVVFLESEEGW